MASGSASPALSGHEFYLRGERFLYCIAEPLPEGRKQGQCTMGFAEA